MPFRLLHHPPDIGQQFFRIVDNAILYGVAHPAHALGQPRLIVKALRSGAVEHLKIFQWIFLNDYEVCEKSWSNKTILNRYTFWLMQCLSTIQRGRTDDFKWVEACLLKQLKLTNVTKAVKFVDKT